MKTAIPFPTKLFQLHQKQLLAITHEHLKHRDFIFLSAIKKTNPQINTSNYPRNHNKNKFYSKKNPIKTGKFLTIKVDGKT